MTSYFVSAFFTAPFVSLLLVTKVFAADATPNLTVAGAVEEISSVRGRINLNGLWKFQPAQGSTLDKPLESDWGTMWVPGTWARGAGRLGSIQSKGKSDGWKIPGEALIAGWYERTIPVPMSWSGREIFLDLRRVSTDAQIWVNGQDCGKIQWPHGQVIITNAVKPGQDAKLRVMVIATPDEGEKVDFMGYAQESKSKAQLSSAGIIGEVFLESRPRGAFVSDLFVKTSTRKGEISLEAELSGLVQAGDISFTAIIRDSKGGEVKKFTQSLPAKAEKTQVLTMTWSWTDAKLWDLDQPNLYTLYLSAKGAGLQDEAVLRFGFREFWIEGRNFILNGIPLRLRPALLGSDRTQISTMDSMLTGMRAQGFNICQIWPDSTYERGKWNFHELWAERADEKGMPMIHVAEPANRFLFDSNFKPIWSQNREKYQKVMEAELRRIRNHPSILIWGTMGNLANHQSDQNPRYIGQKAKLLQVTPLPDGVAEILDMIKKVDPTRPVFAHAGNRAGDIFTSNHYLNFIPLQEREEWLSDYVKTGDVPYIGIEFGIPLNISWMRGRAGYGPSLRSEPLGTEFAAIYGGSSVYGNEPSFYRNALVAKKTDKGWGGEGWERILNEPAPIQDLQSLLIRNTWRSWRTAGLTGGMVPWNMTTQVWQVKGSPVEVPQEEFKPGSRGVWKPTLREADLGYLDPKFGWEALPSAKVLTEVNSETLAWIAGPPESFTQKNKSFRVGEEVIKQAVLINDTRTSENYSFTWTAFLAGKEIAKGNSEGKINPAQNIFVPIKFKLPAALALAKESGEIKLIATIAGRKHEDTFVYRVFSKAATSPMNVLVFDPIGKTTSMLKNLGITAQPWDGKPSTSLLVIGREALSSMAVLPGDLRAYTESGGRVIIMTQKPDWLRSSLGLRISRHATRYVYPVDPSHPVLANLDALDLRDWNGSTTLTESRPEEPNLNAIPVYGWKWGNQGVVASAAIEKPHRSGWRPLLETEFDLAYSPLMQLDFGKGRVTLCTLDLEDQYQADPVAEKLARQLLNYTASAPLPSRSSKVVYIGGKETAEMLNGLALVYEKATALDPSALNILGADAEIDASAVASFINNGGRIIELARTKEGESRGLNFKIATDYHGSIQVPNSPLFAGLSASDLRMRTELNYCVIEGGDNAEVLADGLFALRGSESKGFALSTQLDPSLLDVEKIPALRFTRWRQTRALAQILANCGATFLPDQRIFNPRILVFPLALTTWKAQMTIIKPPVPTEGNIRIPDPGISPEARQLVIPEADETRMETLAIPSNYSGFDKATGEAVFRLTLDLPQKWAGQILSLELGTIADFDTTYFNGVKVGGLDDKTKNFNNIERKYRVPGNLVKAGRNVIAVRVWDSAYGPGIYGRASTLRLRLLSSEAPPANFYHADYEDTFEFGDEPYRYYRW